MRGAIVIASLAASAWACGRAHGASSDSPPAASTSSTTAPAAAASAAPLAEKSPAPPADHTVWHGTYTSVAATIYIPADWKNVHWKVADTPAGLGPGTMTITLEATSGRVFGAIEGPLGPATIDGYAADGKLTANLAAKDPAVAGFAGTLVGTVADGHAEGTMNVSLGEASAIRSATFALTPGDSPSATR